MKVKYVVFILMVLAIMSFWGVQAQTVFGVEPPSGDYEKYGITYTKPTAGERRWHVSNIRHYPVGSNDWRHNLYVSTYNWTGWPNDSAMHSWSLHVPEVKVPIICWWSGEETPYPLPQDHVILNTWEEKPMTEPGVNFPMEMDATYKVAVYTGEPGSSGIVSNIHTRHPDEGPDVTMGHHSFDVYFTAMESVGPTPTWTLIPTETPVVEDVEQVLREAAWNRLYPDGVNYNPTAAFQAVARARDYGAPVTNEFDVNEYRVQGFSGAILYCIIGDWQNIKVLPW